MAEKNRHMRRREGVLLRQQEVKAALFQKKLAQYIQRYFPYYVAHINGCGKVAFYCTQMPDVHGAIHPDTVMYPNGNMPAPQEEAKCGSCGEKLLAEEITYDAVRMTR